jgi:hypothetical protein
MDVGHVHIDLTKSGYLCVNCFVALPAQEKPKTSLDFNVIFERDLCPWKQTHGHVWLAYCRETSCTAVGVVTSLSPTFAGRLATLCRL